MNQCDTPYPNIDIASFDIYKHNDITLKPYVIKRDLESEELGQVERVGEAGEAVLYEVHPTFESYTIPVGK